MKVVCAWCQHAGQVMVLREMEPQDEMISHGICAEHAVAVLAAAGLSVPPSAFDRRDR